MFDRELLLLDKEEFLNIKSSRVLLVGIGGVGGIVFESLIRLGIHHITIVDNDVVDITNMNRQILYTHQDIGKNKVDVASHRGKCINPDVEVIKHNLFLNKENIDEVFKEEFDFIIDACDTVSAKVELIKKSITKNIPIIVATGSGNRIDATKLAVKNIWETSNDPLAKVLRSQLRKDGINEEVFIPVIASDELPHKLETTTIGTIITVPNMSGLLITDYIFKHLKSHR